MRKSKIITKRKNTLHKKNGQHNLRKEDEKRETKFHCSDILIYTASINDECMVIEVE